MHVELTAIVTMLILSGAAGATPITNAVAGLAAPAKTITFSEVSLANETQVTNQFAAFGATFSPGLFLFTPQPFTPPDFSDVGLAGFRYSGFCCTQAFTITFTTPVSGAAFAAISANRSATFTALLNGQVVESFIATVGSGSFFGFDNVTLDQIQVQMGDPFNGGIAIDTVELGQTTAMPEANTLLLVILSLVAFIGAKPHSFSRWAPPK